MTTSQFRAFLAVAIVCGLVFAGILTWHATHGSSTPARCKNATTYVIGC